MKSLMLFFLYFFLGIFLIFSVKKISQILNSQQLITPLPQSSFSLDVAPSESLRGTIISLSGDVGWQSRTATEPAKITRPMQIQQGEGITTKEKGRTTVIFSNTAIITISPKTEINFVQTLPNNILIRQDTGAADYIKLNDNPLNVRSLDLLIKINQGEILVSVIENQPYIIIGVKSGSITVGYNDINYISKILDVTAGNNLIFRTDTKITSVIPL